MLIFLFGSGMGGLEILAFLVAYLIVIIFSLSMHEFAHAFTAYRFGDRTAKAMGRLSLNPFKHLDPIGFLCLLLIGFGWAKPVQVNPNKFKNYKLGMSMVSLAGIFTNLIFSFIFSGLLFFGINFGWFLGTALINTFLYWFLTLGFSINLVLAIFNLLPIHPLDGFNFIRTFLKYDNKFVQFMLKYGSIVLLVFLITPLFDIVVGALSSFFTMLFNYFWALFI